MKTTYKIRKANFRQAKKLGAKAVNAWFMADRKPGLVVEYPVADWYIRRYWTKSGVCQTVWEPV